MCELQKNPNETKKINNMYLVKVHGGTTSEEIIKHVEGAQILAKKNLRDYPGMFTILFFDEANSTEAIGTIKEIMCDLRMNGKDLESDTGLKIIAACNPYKKHSENVIKNFEKSGLGFYVDMNETQEKLGDLPMRHLVYRVQPLPASMLPIIWDFGQLNDNVERLYITQIVTEKFSANGLCRTQIELIITLLACSQKFMREQKNECSFVSLRDIQRVLKIINWFLKNGDEIFKQMTRKKHKINYSRQNSLTNQSEILDEEYLSEECVPKGVHYRREYRPNRPTTYNVDSDVSDEENEEYLAPTKPFLKIVPLDPEISEEESLNCVVSTQNQNLNLTTAIILALNTCYHVGLQSDETRKDYRNKISENFYANKQRITAEDILKEINYCYEVFLDEIKLPDAIARNQALKENIFMMIMCIELKIPLFIIGKPGSSKSLAKTLISRKMQGSDRTNSAILKHFKESHLITFQCSPLSTSEMILNTFR